MPRKSTAPNRRVPKKRKRRNNKQPQSYRNWTAIIDRLVNTKSGRTRITMGSPGSAQVTRARLLETFAGIDVRTEGDTLIIEVTD